MPKKPIPWIGSVVILAVGIFCIWALLQYRNDMTAADAQFNVVTIGVYAAPVLAVVAIFLWYYFNEKV